MPFGSFESSGSENKEKEEDNTEEKEDQEIPRPSSWQEQLKYYAKIAAIVGVTSVFTVRDIGDATEQQYRRHLDESLNRDKKEYLDSLYSEIRSYAGEGAVQEIKDGDKAAYAEENEPPLLHRQQPDFHGFENTNVNQGLLEHLLSEDFFFPQNWIRGEIKEITFIDKGVNDSRGQTHGGYLKPENAVLFFPKDSERLSEENSDYSAWYFKHKFTHEIAHANDWETDHDLDVVERAELLSSVINRLQSENSYRSPGQRGDTEYYETELDGSKEGRLRAAEEYWAQICQMYFSWPEYLKENHPEDFDIVDEYVSKQDPDFDPFASGGPYFDGRSGEMLPKWKDYIESQMESSK